MTRKRFVKLLMSDGYSRNEANREARSAVIRGASYDSMLLCIMCKKYGLLPAGWDGTVGDAVFRIKLMVDDAVRIIAECIPTIVEAINAAIPQVIANIERLKQEAETATE